MLESVEHGRVLGKKDFEKREAALLEPLLDAQFTAKERGDATLLLLSGLPGAGRGSVANRLSRWLNTKYLTTHALQRPSELERAMPFLYRFWSRIPGMGHTSVVIGSWYGDLFEARVWGRLDDGAFRRRIEQIRTFEKTLHDEGWLLIKCWLHLSKEAQRNRLVSLENDPAERWRVLPEDWLGHARYHRYREAAEEILLATHTIEAPWTLVDAHDGNHRDMAVGEQLLDRWTQRAARPAAERPPVEVLVPPPTNALRALPMAQELKRSEYREALESLQGRLGRLSRMLTQLGRSVVLVFEGQDAAGKGGAIGRVTQALDARFYRVHATSAPSDEERAHPWIWRFWRRLPKPGHVAVFDRSWYGRVLVERVEGFCTPADAQRAFGEINAFEDQLMEAGMIVLKFWIAITPEEQLQRFQARDSSAHKRHKLTEEDWRNRDKWDAYEAAACDTFARTSRSAAPWILVEGNHKWHARLKVLRTVCEHIEAQLDMEPLPSPSRNGKEPAQG